MVQIHSPRPLLISPEGKVSHPSNEPHFSSGREVEKLALRRERKSLYMERFREDRVAMPSNGGGFAAQVKFTCGASLGDGREFRSRRRAQQAFCAKEASKDKTFGFTLALEELAVVDPVGRGASRVGERSIERQSALVGLRGCSSVTLFFL